MLRHHVEIVRLPSYRCIVAVIFFVRPREKVNITHKFRLFTLLLLAIFVSKVVGARKEATTSLIRTAQHELVLARPSPSPILLFFTCVLKPAVGSAYTELVLVLFRISTLN